MLNTYYNLHPRNIVKAMQDKHAVILCTCACVILTFSTQGRCSEPPPNIIVFLADDMGMGDTSAYQDWAGTPDNQQLYTPALDDLARRGVRFTDAHSPHSRCTTSRYALMTGRYCWRTRLKHWVLFGVQGDPLIERDRQTLPEFLQTAGYVTGMVGKWHLGLSYRTPEGEVAQGWEDADLTQPLADGPMDHGFDFFFGISRSHGTSGPNGNQRNAPDQSIGPGWIFGRKIIGAIDQGKKLDGSYVLKETGLRLESEALKFLRNAQAKNQPFFLYFASPANHSPYTPADYLGSDPIAGASRYVDGTPTGSERCDFIYQNDVHVAHLVDFLQTTPDHRNQGKPLIENTVFVFASDNGSDKPSKIFTGPLRSHKGSLYEGGHRVPLIITWPLGNIGDGQTSTPGRTSDRLIALNDLYATFAEILGRELPPLDGVGRGAEDSESQLACLQDRPVLARGAIFPNDHQEASEKLSDERAWVAVRSDSAPMTGAWKLMLDHRYAFAGEINPRELYDLSTDQQEQRNRITDPTARPALDFLMEIARRAAGEHGHSRSLPIQ
ncbi:MAG: arylsulfatase [Planctomycetales bacterium]|nr:arylsulfatase [Planctomycetales bacterium]